MKLLNFVLIFLFISTSFLFAENKEVSTLLEKVNQAPTIDKRKVLIEKLKEKLAKENKEAREKTDAIIKAKQKIPLKIYNEKSSQK